MEFQNTSMEKSWKIFLNCTLIILFFCAARAHSYDDNEIGVCFIFCGEDVTKRGDVEATVRKVK